VLKGLPAACAPQRWRNTLNRLKLDIALVFVEISLGKRKPGVQSCPTAHDRKRPA
jgi:hypothetical protein